tara:strand:+ start:364 stop:552 length:189 start_codon:yes stop_codon:yes gene_type:complete
MTKCKACGELITPSCTVIKTSIGFVDYDGAFFEDKTNIIHMECNYNYLYNPVDSLEEDIKNS